MDLPEKVHRVIVDSIRLYPSLYASHIQVLNCIFLSSNYRWIAGELVYDNPIKRDYQIPQEWAEHVAKYGYQRVFSPFPDPSSYSPLANIPDDVNADWLETIRQYCYIVNNFDHRQYKIQTLSYYLQAYGIYNPNSIYWYDRAVREFDGLRKLTDSICERFGWTYYTTKELHDPENKKRVAQALNDMIDEVLYGADSKVEAATDCVKKNWERHRKKEAEARQ